MKTFAIIKSGVVVNIGVAEAQWPFEEEAVEIQPGEAAIGWRYEDGAFIRANDSIPADPTLPASSVSANGSVTTYTFTTGQILPEHDHTQGGRHMTLVQSGSFEVTRDGSVSTHGAGAKLYFTTSERHRFRALSAGVVVNTAIPVEVTMRQARLALAAAGLLSTIDTAINALPEPQGNAAKIEWEYSGTVQRTKPLVLQLASTLSLTPAQLDDLFITAAGL